MMKIINDPAEQKIHLAGLGVDIFVGDMNLGMSSNDMDIEPANRDRAHKFGVFTQVSAGARESASRQRFGAMLENFHDSIAMGGDVSVAEITQRKRVASDLFESVLPELLRQAEGDAANPERQPSSARMLIVEDLTFYICDGIDRGTPPSVPDLKSYISDFYQNRTPGESIAASGTTAPDEDRIEVVR